MASVNNSSGASGGNVAGKELPGLFFDALQYYAHSGDVGCLLAPQRMLLGMHNVNGDTALHTAIIGGQTAAALQFVRVMLADDLDIVNSDGQTALHLASLSGQGELAGALVQRGASIVRRDGNGNTCLHLAKDAGVTRAVLRAAAAEDARKAMEVRNDQGYTALHVAAIQGRLDIALELVARHGADVNAQDDSTGRTALHHAVRAGSRPVCELLLEFMADVNAQDSAGNTPLHAAVQFDRFDITKLLVDFGADCVANNAYFQTPLDLAMHYGSTEASRAMSIFPSIRIPNRSLDAVAAAVFPGLAAKARTAPAPASAQPAVVPPASSATVQQQHTVPVRAHRQDAGKASAPQPMSVDEPTPTTTTTTMAARNSSEGEWQMLDPDDVNNEGEMEWQMHHRNKKLTVGMSDKLAKYFNQKRSKTAGGKDRSADKHAAEPAPALRPASTSSRSMVHAPTIAPTPPRMASAPPSTFATANIGAAAPSTPPTSGPSNAKAEKARLAAQFGTPDITVASAPSLSAKEEKRLLEQKYQPKIELQVTEKNSTSTDTATSAGLTKAAEAAASAAANRIRPAPNKFDELSTLD